ncbi:hypothetical protein ACJIZ3_024926 [Penstemon smallii]|uniref:Vacuolar amino acid transporter YPQ1 n=1 Tax=Penstemon smallii TaxID=265156 RepID=A0ABD3TTK0_9LAMI
MKPLNLSYCPVEGKPCIGWIQELFKDCLCNLNDEISFAFGIASLVFWAVAEIPQIITNFNNKSAAGVSLAFLSTWILGDVFNLVGCILEPATLPTQFYTAVLYTTVTIILAIQCVYYNHFIQWWNRNNTQAKWARDETDPLRPKFQDLRKTTTNAPIEVPRTRGFHFMSARSLAGSDSDPAAIQCYIKARSGPPALGHDPGSSSEEEEEQEEEESITININIPPYSNKPATQPRPIPAPVKYGTFAAASANLPHLSRALRGVQGAKLAGSILFLQEIHENAYGQWLGWLMAAIYMGGRIPQIWLNIKRGSVEGLNPLMFVFALVANATYVGSILMRTTEWSMMKANFPWLLDAAVCVVLDFFIILQYIFYKYIKRKRSLQHCGVEYYGDYVEADKPTL